MALSAALAVDGVARTDARWGTDAGEQRLPGVVVAAAGDGTYAVDLYLVARLVPLEALGERVRTELRRTAKAVGLGALLGRVTVRVVDVEPGPGVV